MLNNNAEESSIASGKSAKGTSPSVKSIVGSILPKKMED